MRRVLGLVDHLSGFVLHLLDHLFDLVLCVADLLFGLTSLTIQRKRSSSSGLLARTNLTEEWAWSARQPPDIPEERALRHLGQRRARRRPLSVVGAV